MKAHIEKPLLASTAFDRYVGNIDQIERLYLHAISGAVPFGLHVSGPPGAGTSELLRQVYDRLFREQRFVVPFYFALRPGDLNGRAAAARYVYQFLLQAVAFRRKEPDLIAASPTVCELARLAPLTDADWVERLCEDCDIEGPLNDDRVFIRSALAAPVRAAIGGKLRVCIFVDDLHASNSISDGKLLIDEIISLASNTRSPLILAARKRFNLPGVELPAMKIPALDRDDAALLAELTAIDSGVIVGEEARDLIVAKFRNEPRLIRSFILAARDAGRVLNSFRDVEQLYTDELQNGGIRDHFDRIFDRAAPQPAINQRLVEALYFAREGGSETFSLAALGEKLGISSSEAGVIADNLAIDEVFTVRSGSIKLETDDLLGDYLEYRYRTASEKRTAAFAALGTVTDALKRAPKIMAGIYRSEAAADLLGIMRDFDIQSIPLGLLDYRAFRERYKGIPDSDLNELLAAETDRFTVPQIVRAVKVKELLPEFGEPVEPEKVVAGIGFSDRAYREQDQVAWLAVEIDSKLEADHSLTLEWCDRLAFVAATLGFSNYRIWMVAPEGFSDGSLDLLSERNGFGSSRRQVEFLRNYLKDNGSSISPSSSEYEIVIPMGEETELIAAHALEDIARRYGFPLKSVNQMKTALVEACINSVEHSLSPDRKIYQKFAIYDDKIVITVSNRGLRLADKLVGEPESEVSSDDSRRGWGLNLIRGLMDEVRIMSVDDGTSIVMTKYLKR